MNQQPWTSRARLLLTFHAAKSIQLDTQLLGLPGLSRRDKAAFLRTKTTALATMHRRPAFVDVRGIPFEVRDAFDLGTLQSSLLDVADLVTGPGVLDGVERPVVVDVGANIGQFMAAVTAWHPRASILSIEPDPDSFGRLQANAAPRPGVDTVCAAAGAAPATMTLHRHELSVMSTLRPPIDEPFDPSRSARVDVLPLDEIARDLDRIDLLKIDVEGFELDVIRGATEVLGRTRFVLVEIGLGREASGDNLRVLAQLAGVSQGARIVRVGRPMGSSDHPTCQDVLVQLRP